MTMGRGWGEVGLTVCSVQYLDSVEGRLARHAMPVRSVTHLIHHDLDECGMPLWWCLVQPLIGAMVIVPDDTTVSVVDMAGA